MVLFFCQVCVEVVELDEGGWELFYAGAWRSCRDETRIRKSYRVEDVLGPVWPGKGPDILLSGSNLDPAEV